MDVEFVGQYHLFGRDASDLLISVHPYRDNSFYLSVSSCGDSSILLYEVLYMDDIKDGQSDAKRRKHFDSISKHYSNGNNYKLAFVKSCVLPVPIYFLVSAEGNIWAVSQNSCTEVTFNVPEISCNAAVEFSLDQPVNVCSHEFILSGEYKQNSVCNVSKFSSGILICCEDFLQKCWTVEVMKRGKKPMILFSIPFVSSSLTDYSYCSDSKGPKFSCFPAEGGHSAIKHVPTVTCIEVETEVNQGRANVLMKDKFVAFFGCNLSSNAVVLIGLSDGNVLWQFLHLSDSRSIGYEGREFHLLCNIEQPVRHINILPHVGAGEMCGIIVIGTYGKVMILSPREASEFCSDASSPIAVSVFHIPSPVVEVAVCHQGLLHTSSDGQLWVSAFSCEKTVSSSTLCEAHIMLNFQQLSYYSVRRIVALNHQKEQRW